jgi:hypothetical protein
MILAGRSIGWPGCCHRAALVGGEEDDVLQKTPWGWGGLSWAKLGCLLGCAEREERGESWAAAQIERVSLLSLFQILFSCFGFQTLFHFEIWLKLQSFSSSLQISMDFLK